MQKWRTFWRLWCMQNFQSTWDHEIWYANRCPEDEQLLIWQLLRKTKNTNMAGGWSLKFTLCFIGTTREPLHLLLDKWRFVQWKIMNHFFCVRAFEYGYVSKFWCCVGTNAEWICEEFCNFVQCHTFANYLSCFLLKFIHLFSIHMITP
jgi:hypothetical protein